jgi:hypothetical protein
VEESEAKKAENGSQKQYVFDVTVVNELGLTAQESAILAGLALALGLIGTVLGLPFIKRHFNSNGSGSH